MLSEVLAKHSRAVDFGRQIIPDIIREGYKVRAGTQPIHKCLSSASCGRLALPFRT